MYYHLAVIRRFNTLLILQIVLRAKLLFALICPSYTALQQRLHSAVRIFLGRAR